MRGLYGTSNNVRQGSKLVGNRSIPQLALSREIDDLANEVVDQARLVSRSRLQNPAPANFVWLAIKVVTQRRRQPDRVALMRAGRTYLIGRVRSAY